MENISINLISKPMVPYQFVDKMLYGRHYSAWISVLFLLLLFSGGTSADTIIPTRPVKDGDVLVSNGGMFALGFFSPYNSTNRYVGIWYHKVSEQTVVWVANRDNPVTNSTGGVLSVDGTGNLVLRDGSSLVWSSNVSAGGDCSAQLLDSGNLMLFRGKGTNRVVAWQSFDHPTNTLLPNMKLGLDRRMGLNRVITSWKSITDPGTGLYSYKMEFFGSTQLYLYEGKTRIWRTGTWTGLGWSGVPEMTPNFIFKVTFIDNDNEVIVAFSLRNSSIFSRVVVNETGIVERLTWHEADRRWVAFWSVPNDQCDKYSHCGPFGYCNPFNHGSFECECLPGLEPNSSRDWYLRDGSGGCARRDGTQICENSDGFIKLSHMKVPDTSTAHVDMNMGLKSCREMCSKNCSCLGYANADISEGGRGCITWYRNMIDTMQFLEGGQDLYVRVTGAELAKYSKASKSSNTTRIVVIIVPSVVTILLIVVIAYWYTRKKRGNEIDETLNKNSDFRFYNLSTILTATENFSDANKLGEGGFGSVYKGKLQNGEEIAVKRLSDSSGQGMEEFENEVTLIAKLQHRNLVRLLGCCIQKEEKMLVYEYMPNKGLDSFLFDEDKDLRLDWSTRFQIILGIVRGLLYLHQDSRLKIIHRDLKASNVLLDASLNPKISDFGMARIFGGDQNVAKTRRVVGTYGYMAPEYAMEGLFSVKSDVFSFGILLLEIISGRKNISYYLENSVNLIGHVWDLWRKNEALDVVDSSLGESFQSREILRCIHIALLCVQESAHDRPTMPEVAFMLCSNETRLPSPHQPAFIFIANADSGFTSLGVTSVYRETITIVEAR